MINAEPKTLNRICLQGYLAEKYGQCFHMAVDTPAEAIRALCGQLKGFEADFKKGSYQIFRDKQPLELSSLEIGIGKRDLVIAPVISGAATGLAILATVAITYAVTKILTPVIKPVEYPAEASQTPNFLFNGATNVSAQGICVPLVYGRMRTGSVVVSGSAISERLPGYNYGLVSAQTLRVVDVVSEGEIEGLVDGNRSVYFDDTPLESAVSTYSSSDIEVLTGNRYLLPAGHGLTFTPGQTIFVAGFTLVFNNGFKTVSAFSGNEITVEETLVIETTLDVVTITSYVYNFQDVEYVERVGTETQDHAPGFSQVENTVAVAAQVEDGTPVVRTITGADLDAVRITIRLPLGYYRVTDWGDVNVMWARLKIEVKPDGGSYAEVINTEIVGKTNSPFEDNYRVELPSGVSSWEVRLTKTEWIPQEATSWEDRIDWKSYTTVIDAKLRYPGTALIATALNAKFFNNKIPKRAYDIYGIKLQIPSNYNPTTRVYTGIWDGTFTTAWTDNPAWVLYDILISKRYGLGDYISAAQVDKWELYNIAQFCDELVNSGFGYSSSDIEVLGGNIYELPTGHGQTYAVGQTIEVFGFTTAANNGTKTVLTFSGDQITVNETLTIEASGDAVNIQNTEPRYTFNGVFGKREAAYGFSNAIASNFDGIIYWGSGTVSFSQDRPNIEPVKLVTPANVIDGMLTYSGTSLSERHSVALVSWNDPGNNDELAVEVVEDAALIAELGWKPSDIVAIGCTSRGQAHRKGKRLLVTEQYETDRLSYGASFDHADLTPGNVIAVADPTFAGVRFGGRIVARTTSAITIDAAIELEGGETYEISVLLADGTIETRDITNGSGAGQTVMSLATVLPSLPVLGSMWVITASNVEPRQFTVVSVNENEKNIFDIVAVFRDPDKFARIEEDFFIEPDEYSVFDDDPGDLPVISDIAFQEYAYIDGGSVLSAALISWIPPDDPRQAARIAFYEFQVRSPTDLDYNTIATPSEPEADLRNIQSGLYSVRIRVLDALGGYGQWVSADLDILGGAAPPSDVENFSIQVTGSTALLTWSPVPELDLSHYTIRFSSATTGATWGGSTNMATNIIGNQISLSARVGTYLIKAVDVFGVESVNAALIVSTIAGLIGFNVVETVTEYPDYPGTHEDTYAFDGKLQLGDGLFMADWVTLDSVAALVGSPVPEGTYSFAANYFDLGAVYSSRLTASFDASGWNRDTLAADEENWAVTLQLRTTDDDPSGSPTWTSWQDFLVGDYTARAFEWRIKLFSLAEYVTPFVENLQIIIDMPDRVAGDTDITCPVAGLQVDYDSAFKARPALAVDGQDMDTGDYKTVTLQDEAGFFVKFFNSSDVAVERTFDYLAKGYGVSS